VADELRSVVPASEILEKIQKGEPVEYDDVIVEGDLDLSMLDLQTKTKDEIDFLMLSESAKIVASSIQIMYSEIKGSVIFSNCILQNKVNFAGSLFGYISSGGAMFEGDANFFDAKFGSSAFFGGAKFIGIAIFRGAKLGGDANFSGTKFEGNADFIGAKFGGDANFSGTKFGGDVDFIRVKFGGNAFFGGAKFIGNANFWGAKFAGEALTFRYATFANPESQEDACRRAKNVLERAGSKEEAGYHFYREMEGRRKRNGFINGTHWTPQTAWTNILVAWKSKNYSFRKKISALADILFGWITRFIWYDIIEFVFVQKIFGYGVHPWWLMFWWGIVVIAFAILYQAGNGIIGATQPFDYIKLSFATAIAPGYIAAIFNPGSTGYRLISEYQAVAMAETIVGTFLWAGFIATFARKYMR